MIVTLLGLWDEFGATHSGSGMSVHTRISFLLAPLYFVGPILMASAVANLNTRLQVVFFAAAALWLVFATGFKVVPTSWDGILEKVAFMATMLWTMPLAWILLMRGRDRSQILVN